MGEVVLEHQKREFPFRSRSSGKRNLYKTFFSLTMENIYSELMRELGPKAILIQTEEEDKCWVLQT